jgi:hypothetical protein
LIKKDEVEAAKKKNNGGKDRDSEGLDKATQEEETEKNIGGRPGETEDEQGEDCDDKEAAAILAFGHGASNVYAISKSDRLAWRKVKTTVEFTNSI